MDCPDSPWQEGADGFLSGSVVSSFLLVQRDRFGCDHWIIHFILFVFVVSHLTSNLCSITKMEKEEGCRQ